jgi:putative PIN family toxin of toxin-antitoxin system
MSEELLDEISSSLKQKIKLRESPAARILEFLRENSTLVVPAAMPCNACRNPKDIHLIGLAVAGCVDCLVTGDDDLLVLKTVSACRVLSPRAFWEAVRAME